jgi:acyl-CoA hydrolase
MRFLSRKIVMPTDLNSGGTLFGGTCLAWIDEAAAIYVMTEIKKNKVVTKRMSEIDFIAPAFQNDIVEIGVALKKLGQTSVTVEVEVRNLRTKQTIVNVDEIVFVCLDENNKPMKHGMVK